MVSCSTTSSVPSEWTMRSASNLRTRMSRACALASPAKAQKARPMTTRARRILERDLWQLAITRLGLKEFELLVAERAGDEVRRHRRDGGIEVAHDGVVVTPR